MLLAALVLHVAMQATPPQRGQRTVVRDSTPADSAQRGAARRLPVTASVLASAFRDSAARDLFARARATRIAHDSSLRSYDAKVRQRLSVWAAIGKLGGERLVYRHESAARVQWQRDVGAHIDLTGARVAIPIVGSEKANREALRSQALDASLSPIPYFPGTETLWIGGSAAEAEVNERELVNPIAAGAEAYYTYQTGDSVSFRLPDGHTVQLRELKVRPRAPKWNLAVGSLWFDTRSGQLVRAAYRLAVPAKMQIGVSDGDSSAAARRISKAIGMIFSPMVAQISAIVVEYGLYQGRFWLPRMQSMEGYAQAMFARVPVKLENAFTYASVNADLALTAISVDTTLSEEPRFRRPPPGLDAAARRRWRDSTQAAYRAWRLAREDSVRKGLSVGTMRQCDTASTRVVREYRYDVARLPVELRVPCDLDKLAHSPDLPTSIYDSEDKVFGTEDRDRLISVSLAMAAQAPLSLTALPPPRIQLGPSMTRYNRVEGFSTGLLVEQQLGGGYAATAIGRLGTADQIPNLELALARTNLTRTIQLGVYRRLVSANDWGEPLSFRSSVPAFLFGRDEGFYYRATGADLSWTTDRGPRLEWRAFVERQQSAPRQTTFSLGPSFLPNVEAADVRAAGAAVRFRHVAGLDPRGLRLFTDLRLEGAGGDSTYGRGALDLTLTRALTRRFGAALTVAGGTTVGEVPAQRRWFLGGTQTVRGQRADTTQSGNAFWLGRAELSRENTGFRTALFGDIGWVGDRTKLDEVGRPLSGVGVGMSFFDGLVRVDVARGLYPLQRTRVDLYLGARF